MKTIAIYVLVSILMAFHYKASSQELNASKILEKAHSKIRLAKSFEYQGCFEMKFFDRDDTIREAGICKILKVPQDTITGGFIIMKYPTWTKLYNGTVFASFGTERPDAVIDSVAKTGKKFTLTNLPKAIYSGFYSKTGLKEIQEEAELIERLIDTIISGSKYYQIRILYKKGEELTHREKRILISKASFDLFRITQWSTFQNSEKEYVQRTFKEMKYNTLKASDFALPDLSQHRVSIYKPQKFIRTFLTLGDTIPKIPIFDFNNNALDFDLLKKERVVLDFWYMACAPCIRSFPVMQDLYKRYGEKSEFYGINHIDNSDRYRSKILPFLQKRAVTYPTLLTNKAGNDLLKVNGYPTFYVLEKGIIKFVANGENELPILRQYLKDHWQ